MPSALSGEPQTSERIENLFNNLLEFPAFKTAPVLSSILVFLWQHRGESVGEYSIAVDALGRPPSFDPKTDASVRVLIGRLRARLKEFHATEAYPLKLRIPLGTHEIRWALEEAGPLSAEATAATEASAAATVRSHPYRGPFYATATLSILLAAACLILLARDTKPATGAHAPEAPIPRFWKSFLVSGQRPVIVLPGLMHFSWPKQGVSMRDPSVGEFADWPRSAHVKELAKMWGAPELNQSYLGRGDTMAGVQLLSYLGSLGLQADLRDSGHFESDAPGPGSRIFVGSPYRFPGLQSQLEACNYSLSDSFGRGPVVVRNRNPRPGEPSEYREIEYSPAHRVYPLVVLLLPPTADGNRTLVLLGGYSVGLSTMLSSEAGLARLDEEWRNIGSPQAWELVVQVEVNEDAVLKVRPMAMRPLSR